MTEEQAQPDEAEDDQPEGVWLQYEPDSDDEKAVVRWFPDMDGAREALLAAGVSPGRIRQILAGPGDDMGWAIIVSEEGEEDLVYRRDDMHSAIQLVLGFCEGADVDGLEAMRTLEQAAAENATTVSVGPFTIVGPGA